MDDERASGGVRLTGFADDEIVRHDAVIGRLGNSGRDLPAGPNSVIAKLGDIRRGDANPLGKITTPNVIFFQPRDKFHAPSYTVSLKLSQAENSAIHYGDAATRRQSSGMAKVARVARPVPKQPKLRHFLREWRDSRDWTQEHLAGLIDMSVSTINQLESGKQGFSDSTLGKLADVFGCEPGDILTRDPTKPDYQLWRIIKGMSRPKQEEAIRVLEAINKVA